MYNEDAELFGNAPNETSSLGNPEAGDDFWLTDSIEGLGLGVLGAAEGILEIGNLIPGIDYDIPDNFGMGHAETGAGKFMEGMSTFLVPFMVPGAGWISKGAKLGKGAKQISLVKEGGRLANAAGKVKGGAFRLGKHIAGDKLGLNKRIAPWRQKHFDEKARLWQTGIGYGSQTPAAMSAAAKAAMIGKVPEIAGAAIGGAMVDFSVWDPQEARLSNMIQSIPGLENPVTEFLQYDKGDSKLEGRIKQTLEGAGMGLMVDGFMAGLKGMWRARRVFASTGDSVKAQKAFTSEVIENNVAKTQETFGYTREESIYFLTGQLGIDPNAIHWGATTEEAEKIFFQVERDAVPDTLRDVLSPDDLSRLNATAVKEVERLVSTSLDGALDPVVLRNMAVAGESVRGEYERMGTQILPAMFPAQKNLGRTQHDGRLWTALNAMLSANQEVTVHTGAAMMMLSAWRSAGRPTDKRIINRLLKDSLKDTGHLTGGMDKKKAAKSLKGMKAQHKNIASLLADADKLSSSEILDRVNKQLIKTREFAGSFPEEAGDPFTGIALDVHMGHLLDPTIWKTATGFYGKQKGTIPHLGAMSYRAMIRKTAEELGWESGTQVQESIWAAIAGIKGNLQHFRGNIDDVLDNLHGEALATLWDHNVVIKKLMENPNFGKVMEDGGATPQILKEMTEGTGVFAPRKAMPGVADVDREAMRKAVDTIQQWTRNGASSGAPGYMKRAIAEMKEKALKAFGMSNGFTRGDYDGLPIVSERDASGKKMPKTQGGKGMRVQDFQPENVGAEGYVRGLSDTYRVAGDPKGKRPKMKLPKMQDVKAAVGGTVKTAKDVWDRTGVKQVVGSAGTSRNQIPRVFNLVAKRFKKGTLNVDIGGGAWEMSTEFLKKRGVRNLVYDPYNRTAAHNKKVIGRVSGGRADTATVANVLNVIKEKGARKRVLQQAADAVKPEGEVYISVHNAMRSGGPEATRDGWQNSWPLKKYVDEIEEVFEIVEQNADYIVAKKRTATKRGKALQGKVGSHVPAGKAVSVAYDKSAAQTISTSGGGRVISVQDAVTLKNASFDVSGKAPKVRGDFVDGKPSADGVEVTYDGKFFVTENGYAVRNAEEITMIDGKGYARGKVEYMTREGAVDKGLRESKAEKGGTKFLHQGADLPEGAKGATFMDKLGRIFIAGLSNPDASTGFHELIHGWRLLHANRAITEADRLTAGGLRDFEIDILEDALGMQKGSEWTTQNEEELALFWEKWVWEGEVFQTGQMSDRDFEILQVALAKMSAAQRKVYEGVEHTLPEGAIPEPLRDLFSQAANRSDVQGVLDALGDEARAVYDSVLVSGAKAGKTQVKEELDRYELELETDYPGYKAGMGREDEGYAALPQGAKIKLGTRRAALNRQKEAASTAAEGVKSRFSRKKDAEQDLNDLYADLDAKYGDEGWNDQVLEPEDFAAVRSAREAVGVFDEELPFASRAMEPEGPRTDREPDSGFSEAERRRDLPINVERGVGQFDDMATGDSARDLLEIRVLEEAKYLKDKKHTLDAADIEASEAKHYDDLRAAAKRGGKGSIEKYFKITDKKGIEYIARSRAIRSLAADIFASAEDAAARLELARESGNVDRKAQADFLYYTGLFDPLVEELNGMSYRMGLSLADMKKEPWGQVADRGMDDETIEAALNATQTALTNSRSGETVDEYIDRMLVAMKEGQLNLINAATGTRGDKLDTVLEVFYNSILSGPRTHSVNTLSNTIYGTMLHLEKRIGRGMMSMAGSDEFPKTIGTVVGIREMLKESFKLAKVAFAEGSAQYDAAGGRATFDQQKGVYSGKTSRNYAERLGAESMPEPFKSSLNMLMNFSSVGGLPVRALGAMDELFKQMHSRLVVHEELAREAAKRFPGDPTKMAEYIRSEFDTIIGEGNHFTKRRIKYEGLKEAYSKGMNKRDARAYAEKYYEKTFTTDRAALADRALNFSRRSTFTHPNSPDVGLNPVSRQVQTLGKALSGASKEVRWLRFLAPFVNTPTNLLSEATDHLLSPIFDGVVPGYKKLKQIIGKGTGEPAFSGTPEEKAEALGRLAVSSSIISLVWMKANSGEITGGGPKDPNAQKLLREAGWQPYSIRFGDSYVGYGRLDPLASVVGIVADISEGMNGNPYTDDPEEEGAKALLMGTVMALFRNLSEKSYLSGMINFASAMDNPEHYGKSFAHNLTGAIVPNALAQVASELDPTVRDVRGITDKWKSRIPGMSGDLLPKRNFLGEEQQRVQYLGGSMLGLLSPIPHSEVSNDVVKREVTKFGEVIGPPSPLKYGTLDMREYSAADGSTAYDRFQQLQGEVQRDGIDLKGSLEQLINSDQYNALPNYAEDGSGSPKMDLIRGQVTKYRGTAWNELLKEFPMLKENYGITLYNRSARKAGRAERDLLSLID